MNRRTFLDAAWKTLGLLAAAGTLIGAPIRKALAETARKLVKKGTPMAELIHEDPAELDSSALQTTPLEDFGVMGQTDLDVDIASWRLQLDGEVDQEVFCDYQALLQRPKLERHALLICPGFFAYNGLWTGFSVARLLEEHGVAGGAGTVTFEGSQGARKESKSFSLSEVMADRVFIAYAVNGVVLPRRHGYPLRLVAPDHYGLRWVKYLNRITVEKV